MRQFRSTIIALIGIPCLALASVTIEETVLGVDPAPYSPISDNQLSQARTLTRGGSSLYFVGLGLKYVVSVPLSFIPIDQQNGPGLAILSLGVGALSSGLQISGGVRAGVGASMAYDYGFSSGAKGSRNTNWAFYRGAWGLQAANAVLGVMAFFIAYDWASSNAQTDEYGYDEYGDSGASTVPPASLQVISLLSLGLGIATDALFITSVANSLNYTKNADRKVGSNFEFNLSPVLSYKGDVGAVLSLKF